MKRYCVTLILVLAALAIVLGADVARAADAAGSLQNDLLLKNNWRGPGFYLSWIKVLTCWLVFLAWVRSTDWVSRDCQNLDLKYDRWNPIVFGTFLGAFVLLWLLPWFWVGFPLLMIAYVGPLAAYILYRNSHVLNNQRILTPEHLRWWLSRRLRRVGLKVAAEAGDPNRGGTPLTVFAQGGPDAAADSSRMLAARQSPGLPAARKLLADALSGRASAMMLDLTASSVGVRYLIDGVWLPRDSLEREKTDPALKSLKLLCGLNAEDRQSRQEGTFGVEYFVLRHEMFDKLDKAEAAFREQTTIELTKKYASDELTPPQLQQKVAVAVEERARAKFATPVGPWTPVDRERLPKLEGVGPMNQFTSVEPVRCPCTLAAQGGTAAERVIIQFQAKGVRLASLDELGMRAKMQEQLKDLLARTKGLVLLSAMPAGGLRTTTKIVLVGMDRFMREFAAVEDEAARYEEIENILVTTYKSAEGKDPASVLPKVFRFEPNVVVMRDLVNAESVTMVCREVAAEERLVIGTVRAKDCAEALLRVLAMGVSAKEFAPQIAGVLCQRLIRTLCDKCKEAYAPPPQVLQQMGIPAGRVKALYRPLQRKPGEEDRKDVCRECGGIGYKGQTAIFELLVVDDNLRNVLVQTPKLDLVRQAARKAGMKALQEEGVLMVVRGVTSLPELMRVLKQ